MEMKASKTQVAPGDTVAIAVIFDFAPGWHVHTNAPVLTPGMKAEKFTPIPTVIEAKPPPGLTIWATQWPKSSQTRFQISEKFGLENYGVFQGHAVAYVPARIPATAKPGSSVELPIQVGYQACDERNCDGPVDETPVVKFDIVDLSAAGAAKPDPVFKDFDIAVFGTPPLSGGGSQPVNFSAFGWEFTINAAGAGLLLLLLVAAFGGLLLNFTPCVLPVIPLKIMGLSQAAGNPSRCFYLGSVMSLGLVAFWVGIGAAIAFISGFTAINSLFQTPWFSLCVGAFILVMAVGMLGAFAVRLPQVVYLINPNHESAGGSFLFGIMTAILSTPCTAPFMGSAAAWAAKQRGDITLLTFGAIGFGMALPYLVLSAFPKFLSKMPRTGPASELIKQVMGLLMIAVGVFFLGTGLDPMLRAPVDSPILFYWWIIAAFGVGAMVLLVRRTFAITKRTGPRVCWTVFGLVFSAVTVLTAREITDAGPIPWIGYTPERLAEQLGKKKTVVLDFTAQWCLSCKALESGVLHRPEIVKLLTGPDVVPMRVDLTGNNLAGKAKLQEFNSVAIPLLVVLGPGTTEPFKSDAYTVDMVKSAIAKAMGSSVTAGPEAPEAATVASGQH